VEYSNDGKFILSLQVALFNPVVQVRQLYDPVMLPVEELYATYYTTVLRNSIAYLFCTAVQDVLFVNTKNQNVCPTIIASVNESTTGNEEKEEEDSLSDSVSIDSGGSSSSSSTGTVTPTILDEVPYQLRIVPRNVTIGNNSEFAGDTFAYTIWYIDYTIIQIGSVYIEEAIIQTGSSNGSWNRTTSATDSTLDIAKVSIEAVKAMNVVLQLTLDVNTMDTSAETTGSDNNRKSSSNSSKNSVFDTIVQTISNTSFTSIIYTGSNTEAAIDTANSDPQLRSYLCSSPVVEDEGTTDQSINGNIMILKFTSLYEQYHNSNNVPYRSPTSFLTPMRVGGIILLFGTIFIYMILLFLSASRRQRRSKGLLLKQQPHRKAITPQHLPPQQNEVTTPHPVPISTKVKTLHNRVLAVPPSVPSSPMVRMARMESR
jgi:hypothetical protein